MRELVIELENNLWLYGSALQRCLSCIFIFLFPPLHLDLPRPLPHPQGIIISPLLMLALVGVSSALPFGSIIIKLASTVVAPLFVGQVRASTSCHTHIRADGRHRLTPHPHPTHTHPPTQTLMYIFGHRLWSEVICAFDIPVYIRSWWSCNFFHLWSGCSSFHQIKAGVCWYSFQSD